MHSLSVLGKPECFSPRTVYSVLLQHQHACLPADVITAVVQVLEQGVVSQYPRLPFQGGHTSMLSCAHAWWSCPCLV